MFTGAVQLCLTVALFATAASAGVHDHLFTVSPGKDSKCHSPMISNCNSSLYPILDYKLTAWFFHQPFKTCRPLYASGGVHNCTGNRDLPSTREECEQLCGEKCSGSGGRTGLCTMDEHCKPSEIVTSIHPRPCGAYGVKCCARLGNPAPAKTAFKSSTSHSEPLAQNSIDDGAKYRYLRVPLAVLH